VEVHKLILKSIREYKGPKETKVSFKRKSKIAELTLPAFKFYFSRYSIENSIDLS
jgi:hypothetical protein